MQSACSNEIGAYEATIDNEFVDSAEQMEIGVTVIKCANDFISRSLVADCANEVDSSGADDVEAFQSINQCLHEG